MYSTAGTYIGIIDQYDSGKYGTSTGTGTTVIVPTVPVSGTSTSTYLLLLLLLVHFTHVYCTPAAGMVPYHTFLIILPYHTESCKKALFRTQMSFRYYSVELY
jgi:hypothetical protein